MRPVLDFMQTLPAFVYLLPVVMLFGVGETPGIIATIIFCMPPGVRLTELGLRQVDREVVEAAQAFGSSPGRTLVRVKLPLALPTIMAGLNQVIMLALSMVVIAGMVGGGGLGEDIVSALGRVDIAKGFNAGIAVVILAIFLDRVMQGLADRTPVARAAKLAR
jgi:glycine betaine/proline transport system permease protein